MLRSKEFNSMRIYIVVKILSSLDTKPKIMRAIEIETGCRLHTIAKALNPLEKSGFVTTKRSGRVRYCAITEKGKSFLLQLQSISKSSTHL